jgi:phage/plasmid primase-like uncharacterized protein
MINDDATPTPDDDSIPDSLPDGPIDYEPSDDDIIEMSHDDTSTELPMVSTSFDSPHLAFREFLLAHDLAPAPHDPLPFVEGDRAFHRISCALKAQHTGKPNDAGWYLFKSHGSIHIGVCGCWICGSQHTWVKGKGKRLTPEERSDREAALDEWKKSAALQDQFQEDASNYATQLISESLPAQDSHPYLSTKGVKAHGIFQLYDEYHKRDGLIIPMADFTGKIWSFQVIHSEKVFLFSSGNRSNKKNLPRGKAKGMFHAIGDWASSGTILLGEGYATAASIHEATGLPVLVCFSCHNFEEVAANLRKLRPHSKILICGDDDSTTPGNPGRTKAQRAAVSVQGLFALPKFKIDPSQPIDAALSDFNDLARSEGRDTVRTQILDALSSLPPSVRLFPNIVYISGSQGWAIQRPDDSWFAGGVEDAKRIIKAKGFSFTAAQDSTISDGDLILKDLQYHQYVDYYGPVSGYPKGENPTLNGHTVLCPSELQLITPAPGPWPFLESIFVQLYGTLPQLTRALAWMAHAAKGIYNSTTNLMGVREFTLGNAIVLCGQAGKGKGLQQTIITMLLGGGTNASQFITGKTTFNGDLIPYAHLYTEDQLPSHRLEERLAYGSAIKAIAANRSHSAHTKNRTPIQLNPFWRISISLNNDPNNLLCLPPLDDSIRDKLLILKCENVEHGFDTADPVQSAAMTALLHKEMPGFIHFLLNEFEIPPSIYNRRFGVEGWCNPEIAEILGRSTFESELMETIEDTLGKNIGETLSMFQGTVRQLDARLRECLSADEARRMLPSLRSIGISLTHLSKNHPDLVAKTLRDGCSVYRINKPTGDQKLALIGIRGQKATATGESSGEEVGSSGEALH